MILGMSSHAFTLLHITVSLLAIASGIATLCGLLAGRLYGFWNFLFLITASLTSITGFAFPNSHITPGIVVGILSLIALAIAAIALRVRQLNGVSRSMFVVSTVVALYFNLFVLIAQLFRHVQLFKEIDPTGTGPAFAASQLLLLVAFIWLGIAAVMRFTTDNSTRSQAIGARPASIQSWSE
jgi:hypothetical protein